jgi:hypothetical protein
MPASAPKIDYVHRRKSACKNFSDPEVRRLHFLPASGRPDDALIIETISKQICNIIEQGFGVGYVFRSDQLCQSIWKRFPNQHQYIGQRIRILIKDGRLAIRKVGVRSDKRVLYAIVFDD